jgi:hypothetical protein
LRLYRLLIADRGYVAFLSPIAAMSSSYRRLRLYRLLIADRGYVAFLSPIAATSPSYRRSRLHRLPIADRGCITFLSPIAALKFYYSLFSSGNISPCQGQSSTLSTNPARSGFL